MKKAYADYLVKKTKEDYNLIAEQFSNTRHFFWKDLMPLIEYTTIGDKVLDLGCGNGRLFSVLKDKDADYFGVDSSEKLIEIAQKKYPEIKERFFLANALNLPFSENYFNKIYSIAVFHHIPSQKLRIKFLQEANRVLKPGGYLILTVWRLSWQKRIKLILKYNFFKKDILVPWGKVCERYIYRFSKKSLKKIVQRTGFKIKKVEVLKTQRKQNSNIFIVAQKI